MIEGRFSSNGEPLLECQVWLPSLSFREWIEFLVDTGAQYTCLHSSDVEDATDDRGETIVWDSLSYDDVGVGVGGEADYSVQKAYITFIAGEEQIVLSVDVRVARPGPDSPPLPSVLGRDVLEAFEMTYAPHRRVLRLEIVE